MNRKEKVMLQYSIPKGKYNNSYLSTHVDQHVPITEANTQIELLSQRIQQERQKRQAVEAELKALISARSNSIERLQ